MDIIDKLFPKKPKKSPHEPIPKEKNEYTDLSNVKLLMQQSVKR